MMRRIAGTASMDALPEITGCRGDRSRHSCRPLRPRALEPATIQLLHGPAVRSDVLVHAEEVRRIIPGLDGSQTFVVSGVCGLDPLLTLVLGHVVDVAGACGEWADRVAKAACPPDVLLVFFGVCP